MQISFNSYRVAKYQTGTPKREAEEIKARLQAALAGAGGLHVSLVTFLLADSALHHDTTLGLALAHAQLNIFRNDGGIGLVVAGGCSGSYGIGKGLVDGGLERRLREQPARHQREVVRHSRATC